MLESRVMFPADRNLREGGVENAMHQSNSMVFQCNCCRNIEGKALCE